MPLKRLTQAVPVTVCSVASTRVVASASCEMRVQVAIFTDIRAF